jgi:hypothetical protein
MIYLIEACVGVSIYAALALIALLVCALADR